MLVATVIGAAGSGDTPREGRATQPKLRRGKGKQAHAFASQDGLCGRRNRPTQTSILFSRRAGCPRRPPLDGLPAWREQDAAWARAGGACKPVKGANET